MIGYFVTRCYDALLGTMLVGGVERSRVEVLKELRSSDFALTPDMLVAADKAMARDDSGYAAAWWRGVVQYATTQTYPREFDRVPLDAYWSLQAAGVALWQKMKAEMKKSDSASAGDWHFCAARRRFMFRYHGPEYSEEQVLEELKRALKTLPPEQRREFRSLTTKRKGPQHAWYWEQNLLDRLDTTRYSAGPNWPHSFDPSYGIAGNSFDFGIMDDLVGYDGHPLTGRTRERMPELQRLPPTREEAQATRFNPAVDYSSLELSILQQTLHAVDEQTAAVEDLPAVPEPSPALPSRSERLARRHRLTRLARGRF